jgi:2-polyprenyl-3-methyl-5-hydroxy-6-metoxy-1,4-benzoquinol methylase
LMRSKDAVVDGIELDAHDVALASKKLRHVWQLNVETDSLDDISTKYDVILMIDVIEHLVNPEIALRNIATLLKPDGRLIFSVPNMAHVSVRMELLRGNFNYTKTGLLDDTHLHFYTETSLRRVITNAHYELTALHSTSITYAEELLKQQLSKAHLTFTQAFAKMIHDTAGDVYQFIGVAQPFSTPTKRRKATLQLRHPHDVHHEELDKVLRSHQAHIAHIEKQNTLKEQHIVNLESELEKYRNTLPKKLLRKLKKKIHP